MHSAQKVPLVAIACGGTGGHLFPGLAVAEVLARTGCSISLMVSSKDVDQQAVRSTPGLQVVRLPAVGLVSGQISAFVRGFWQSYRAVKQTFRAQPPQAVLAMGGFTSAAPILAGRGVGAATFLHESNSIPGRANRWLAPFVDAAFIGFPSAARRLHCHTVKTTGTPVRPQFQARDAAACRAALGLETDRPVLLVMGGSQGASGVNQLVAQSLPQFSAHLPDLQILHLTGQNDLGKISDAYAAYKLKAVVRPFLAEMELALGAATAAVSRSGASSLAELAAMRVPAVLIPYPSAVDNHQFYNAWAFVESGAARMLEQEKARPETLVEMVKGLIEKPDLREGMKQALAKWSRSDAAAQIAAQMLEAMTRNGVHCPALAGAHAASPPQPVAAAKVKMQTTNAG
jgi:UDP-N-acetylglucosamine--N-acetylmuramyl-(pentapeptide) pyrophosphoryl-undecaprenol N-acetylglucosamine transferase